MKPTIGYGKIERGIASGLTEGLTSEDELLKMVEDQLSGIGQGERVRIQKSSPREFTSEDVQKLIESTETFGLTPDAVDRAIRAKYEPKMAIMQGLRESLDNQGPMLDLRYAQPLVTALGGRNLKVPGPDDTRLQEAQDLAQQMGEIEVEKLKAMQDIFKSASNIIPRGQVMMAVDAQKQLPPRKPTGGTFEDKINKDLFKEELKIRDSITGGLNALGAVRKAVNTGNRQTIKSQLSQLARINGEKGVLTNQDIERQLSTSLGMAITDINSFLNEEFGKHEFSQKQLQVIVDLLENNLKETASRKISDLEAAGSTLPYWSEARGPDKIKGLRKMLGSTFVEQAPPKKRSVMDIMNPKTAPQNTAPRARDILKAQPMQAPAPTTAPTPEPMKKKKSLWEVLSK